MGAITCEDVHSMSGNDYYGDYSVINYLKCFERQNCYSLINDFFHMQVFLIH